MAGIQSHARWNQHRSRRRFCRPPVNELSSTGAAGLSESARHPAAPHAPPSPPHPHPVGTGAPVMISIASPAPKLGCEESPARTSPRTVSVPGTSAERTANPSRNDLSSAWLSRSASTGSAKIRWKAFNSGTRSAALACTDPRTVSITKRRASSKSSGFFPAGWLTVRF